MTPAMEYRETHVVNCLWMPQLFVLFCSCSACCCCNHMSRSNSSSKSKGSEHQMHSKVDEGGNRTQRE